MKNTLLFGTLVAALAVLLWYSGRQTASDPEAPVGRYQMEALGDATSSTVFLLDTKTGVVRVKWIAETPKKWKSLDEPK